MGTGGQDLTELPPVSVAGHQPSGLGDPSHPMRVMTRRAARLEPPPWDDHARSTVAAFFDELAPTWHTRSSEARTAVVLDALERGGVVGADTVVEVGSGIGAYSSLLSDRFARTISLEISEEMLHRAPADASHRVLADAASLPLADGRADAVVLVNAFLFPVEVDRVLAPGGCVVWVNSSGEETPIHLTASEVQRALPGTWRGSSSRAGVGTWCVLRRG